MNSFEVFADLEKSVQAALGTYSNVHRGSGQFSMVSTNLYEKARDIVLEYLGLDKRKFAVIFCSPRYAGIIMAKLKTEDYYILSSHDFGLPLAVRALAVRKIKFPKGVPSQSGGGTTRLISPDWIIWAGSPDRFEAGTPAIINVIAFARALQLIKKHGKEIFLNPEGNKLSASDILYSDEFEKLNGHELLEELKKTMIGRGILVPTADGIRTYINLDNSASTPAFGPVWKAVCDIWKQTEEIQQEIIHEVRTVCAGSLGAPTADYDIIFTTNTTESINLVAGSLMHKTEPGIEPVVLSTLLEHSSNDLPWRFAAASVIRLSIDDEGFVSHEELDRLLSEYNEKNLYGRKRIKIVAVSGASNVLGSVNNLEEISLIVHKYGALLLADAAQLVAHRKVEMKKWGVDYLAFSAHKVYAPFGTGVLVIRKGLFDLHPVAYEQIKSSGEENICGITALGKSLILMQRVGMELVVEEEKVLTKRALTGLSKINGLKIYGISDPESPRFDRKVGVIVFFLKGFMSDKVAKELSVRRGIGIRYGCHCAHILVKHILGVSPSLQKFQKMIARLFPRLRFPGVARISFGLQTTNEEVDTLIEVLNKTAAKTNITNKKETEKQMDEFVKAAALKVF